MHAGVLVVNDQAIERDIAYRRFGRIGKDIFIVMLVRDRPKETHTRLLGDAQLARTDHVHIGDNGVGDLGDIGDARAILLDAIP